MSKDLAWFVDSIIGVVCGRATPVLMLSDSNQLKFAQNQHQDSPESASAHHPTLGEGVTPIRRGSVGYNTSAQRPHLDNLAAQLVVATGEVIHVGV